MPSGGPRARSGPAPDPNALRRDRKSDAATWTTLPAAGREGDPPECPLIAASERETDMWAELWALPQATMWETLQLEREVALYVRKYFEAEAPGSKAADAALVLRMADSLGLNTAGMARNRWRIGHVAEVSQITGPVAPTKRPRDRFRVVDGAA